MPLGNNLLNQHTTPTSTAKETPENPKELAPRVEANRPGLVSGRLTCCLPKKSMKQAMRMRSPGIRNPGRTSSTSIRPLGPSKPADTIPLLEEVNPPTTREMMETAPTIRIILTLEEAEDLAANPREGRVGGRLHDHPLRRGGRVIPTCLVEDEEAEVDEEVVQYLGQQGSLDGEFPRL